MPEFADANCYTSACGHSVIARKEAWDESSMLPLWHVSISHASGSKPESRACTAILDEVVPGVVMIEDNTGVSGRVRHFWQAGKKGGAE
jgi:hypothetical protein